ncbi:MAG: radical SAM protein [Polyangia bacterium]|jgi:radical SAM protein with 4Fe4S-binding SPASM domain
MSRTLLSALNVRRLRARHEAPLKRAACMFLHRFGALKPVSFVQWLATNRCNFRCCFCEASAGDALADELSTDEAEALIDELAAMGARLLISGGEPLMREDLPRLLRYARKRRVSLGLVSNGYLVPSMWSDVRDIPWFLFFTSLDGTRAYHDQKRAPGSFDRVIKSLELFAGREVPLRIVNTVVHRENLALLPALHTAVRASRATRWHLTPAAPLGRNAAGGFGLDACGLDELGGFLRAAATTDGPRVVLGESHGYLGPLLGVEGGKPFFCGAGLTRCSILADGTVLGCQQVYDRRLAEGNVREQPLGAIWRRGFKRFRPRALPSSCAGCPQAHCCAGGCWAEMELRSRCLKATLDDASRAPGEG